MWLAGRMNESYAEEIAKHFGGKLKDTDDVLSFLSVLERQSKCAPFNHPGSDAGQNFVSEPYAARCSVCLNAAREFARRLGVRFEVSTRTWHAPQSDAIRFTFLRPK